MYCEFYQLREPPFNVTPDPKFLYLNARYREAIASLNYGITQRKGFITLIGEAGTGKTTLLNKLLEELDAKTKSVFIFNTNVTFEEILEYMFAEFALPVHNGKKLYMLQRLNSFLLEELRGGGNVALLIDEAQDLEFSVLEDLRLLSNLETAKEKILQIVLSGQPELGQKLSNPVLRQLRQRIGINCRLLPLSRDEITEYIQYRLQAAGCPDLKLFSREAEEQIYHFSRGIPRLVNVVCDNALVIGYALGKKRLGADVITEAAADLLSVEPTGDEPEERPVEVAPTPPPIVPHGRWRARFGVMGLVIAAIVVGLLSVGRTVLYRRAPDATAAVPQSRNLQVIRPGSGSEQPAIEIAPRALNPLADPLSGKSNPARLTNEGAPPGNPQPETVSAEVPMGGAPRLGAVDVVAAPAVPPPVTDEENGQLAGEGAPVAGPESGGEELHAALREAGGAERNASATSPSQPAARPGVMAQGSVEAQPSDAPVMPPRENTAQVVARAAVVSPEAHDATDIAAAPPPQDAPAPRIDGVEFAQVVVQDGDSMSQIALRKYGQASHTILDLLKLANPQLRDIDLITVGQTIRLPELSDGFPILNDGSGHYALLVFSTPHVSRANGLREVLRSRGFDAQVSAGSVGEQKPMFRVVLSGFRTREEVIAVGKQLQKLFREDTRVAQLGE